MAAATLSRRIYLVIGDVLTHPRFHPIHRRLYRWTGGRGPVGRALGMDMILITMRGRRSGHLRTVPLAAVREGDSWILIASNAGKDQMPAWVFNLRDAPDASVQWRGNTRSYRASEATGPERDRLWDLVVDAYPGYAAYRDRTERPIPLVVLAPADAVPAASSAGGS